MLFILGTMFLEGSFHRDNYVGEKSSERHSGTISRGILSGGNFLWDNFLGAIIQVALSGGQFSSGAIVRAQFFSGEIILWDNFLGDNNPWVNFLGCNYLGANFPRGQLSGHLSNF